MPLGFRAANAEVRRANLRLAQAFYFLRDQEQKVKLDLQRSYREVVELGKEIEFRRAQREQAAIEVRGRFENFVNGKPGVTLDVLADLLVRAQRSFADALTEEHRAIYEYNTALADFHRQKGTILEHDKVSIAEGPVPECAVARASEHIRERDRSIKLMDSPGCPGGQCGPQLPWAGSAADTVPATPLPPAPPKGDTLPMPRMLERDGKVLPMPRILERNKELTELLEKPPAEVLAPSPRSATQGGPGSK